MANIVFVMGQFYPESDANVVCTSNIIEELKKRGHHIDIICGTQSKSNVEWINGSQIIRLHHVGIANKLSKMGKVKKKIAMFFHIIHSIFMFPFFPNTEIFFSYKIERKLRKYVSMNDVDCIIGVFRPFFSIHSMLKQNDDITKIGYYLDILNGAQTPIGISKTLYDKLCLWREKKVFSKLDLVIMAENGKKHYTDMIFDDIRKKIKYVNFPTLVIKETNQNKYEKKKKFVYAGFTNESYRNPEFVLDLFCEVIKLNPDCELHFYGKTDVLKMLKKYCRIYPENIFYHGEVQKIEADAAIRECDCAINMGNSDLSIVPSKLFELMSLKKPILHIARLGNDSCIQYLKSYPNKCILLTTQKRSKNLNDLLNFCEKKNKVISNEYLLENYYSATPNAVVDVIEKIM